MFLIVYLAHSLRYFSSTECWFIAHKKPQLCQLLIGEISFFLFFYGNRFYIVISWWTRLDHKLEVLTNLFSNGFPLILQTPYYYSGFLLPFKSGLPEGHYSLTPVYPLLSDSHSHSSTDPSLLLKAPMTSWLLKSKDTFLYHSVTVDPAGHSLHTDAFFPLSWLLWHSWFSYDLIGHLYSVSFRLFLLYQTS